MTISSSTEKEVLRVYREAAEREPDPVARAQLLSDIERLESGLTLEELARQAEALKKSARRPASSRDGLIHQLPAGLQLSVKLLLAVFMIAMGLFLFDVGAASLKHFAAALAFFTLGLIGLLVVAYSVAHKIPLPSRHGEPVTYQQSPVRYVVLYSIWILLSLATCVAGTAWVVAYASALAS